MEVLLQYKNIPIMGNSKCKIKDISFIEFDKQKNKIILTYQNDEQKVIYYDKTDEISVTITRKKFNLYSPNCYITGLEIGKPKPKK